MSAKRIILRPAAGLANRMRAIASAVVLCRRQDRDLEIVWFNDYALKAAFSDLFEPIKVTGVSLREACLWDYPRYDVPITRRNLKLPLLYQTLAFRASCRVGLWDSNRLSRVGLPFAIFADTRHVGYVASGSLMTSVENGFSIFSPCSVVVSRMDALRAKIDVSRCFGVHVRRGDHCQATERSPLSLFETEMRQALESGGCDGFYVASDSEEVKARLVHVFGDRIQTSDRPVSRVSVEGIQEAVAEMWTLARLPCILGSCGSTFALTASQMGGGEYRELSLAPNESGDRALL